MASPTTTDNSMKGICRRLLLHHRKKDPESQHPLISPNPSSAAGPTKNKKSRKGFLLRGLGCASSPPHEPHEPHVPESSAAADAVRASAEWSEKRSRKGAGGGRRKNKKKQQRRERGRGQATSSSDVSDVWCAPSGAVFGAAAAVDCVVAHRRGRPNREVFILLI